MKVSEAFLVNTKNFDAIIDALVKYNGEDPTINSNLLEVLGYSDPNDLLVIRLIKDLKIIDNEGKPGQFFDEFQNPKTTKKALAKGLLTAYEGLFSINSKIHQSSLEEIKESFEEYFQGQKTDLILKYISGTFHKVVNYVGVSSINEVQKQEVSYRSAGSELLTGTKEIPANGSSSSKNGTTDTMIDESEIVEFINDPEDSADNNFDVLEESEEQPIPKKDSKDEMHSMEQDDPFDFKTKSAESDDKNSPTFNRTIDMAPFDLHTAMTDVTQSFDKMKQPTTENEFVQKALLRKADLLFKMKRWEDLVPSLQQIIDRYNNTEHPNLKEAVSRSIIRRAITLLKLNKTDEALPALDAVIKKFKDADHQEFYTQASYAMLYKAQILEAQQATSELLPLYNMIINRLDNSSETQLVEKLDHIHLKRFDLIADNGDNEQVLEVSTKLISRFKNRDNTHTYLQKAMIKRAEILDEMNRDEEALEAYNEFLELFGS